MNRSYKRARKSRQEASWSRDSTSLPLIPDNQRQFPPTQADRTSRPTSKQRQSEDLGYIPELTNPYVSPHFRTLSMMSESQHTREHSTMSSLYLQEPPANTDAGQRGQDKLELTESGPSSAPLISPNRLRPAAAALQEDPYSGQPTFDSESENDDGDIDCPTARKQRAKPAETGFAASMGEPGPMVLREATPEPQWVVADQRQGPRHHIYPFLPYLAHGGPLPPPGPNYYNPAAPKEYSRYENDTIMDIPGNEYADDVLCQTWTPADVQELKRQVEYAERFKWKYISDRLSARQRRRIPAVACQRKFREMFGTPEASSRLKTSLFYIAYRSGWPTLRDVKTQLDFEQMYGASEKSSTSGL